MELHSGVLGHASARRLDMQGWKIDASVIMQGALVAALRVGSTPAVAELSHIAALMNACGGDLESVLHFQKDDLQRWARGQLRVFVDVFIGTGALTLVVRNSKHTCSEGFIEVEILMARIGTRISRGTKRDSAG